jgi:hypothetical protein
VAKPLAGAGPRAANALLKVTTYRNIGPARDSGDAISEPRWLLRLEERRNITERVALALRTRKDKSDG